MNKQILLKSRPQGLQTLQNFNFVESDVPKPMQGEILLKVIYFSLDPYMRGRMNDAKSYAKPVELGDVMEAGGVGEVVESNSSKFKVGDIVSGMTGWQEYSVLSDKFVRKIDPDLAPISTSLGVLGMPGLTAYCGLMSFGKPKSGEQGVVSAASGAVGAVVGQIAKLKGCTVIGVAGENAKCDYVINELEFDDCLNHRDENFKSRMREVCSSGVDIYWENVGGITFEAILPLMNEFGRIPVCGLIAHYNQTDLPVSKDRIPVLFRSILTKRLSLRGFIVWDLKDQEEEALKQLSSWVLEGKIKYKEDVVEGIESAPEAFIGLLEGKNFGKMLIKTAPKINL